MSHAYLNFQSVDHRGMTHPHPKAWDADHDLLKDMSMYTDMEHLRMLNTTAPGDIYHPQ